MFLKLSIFINISQDTLFYILFRDLKSSLNVVSYHFLENSCKLLIINNTFILYLFLIEFHKVEHDIRKHKDLLF